MGTYVITGGASGIGAAIGGQLREEGHRVLVADLVESDITGNLATAAGRRTVAAAIMELTADGLAGLVACAGVGPNQPDRGLITSINYFGTVDLIAQLREHLGAHRAAVLLISSNSAPMPTQEDFVQALLAGDEAGARAIAQGMESQQVYSGTKRALVQWMRRNTAAFAAEGTRINAIAPGYTRTPLTAAVEDDPTYGEAIRQFVASIPIGRPGLPEDMARAASFLLGEGASFICGANLFVDGGHDAMLFPDRY